MKYIVTALCLLQFDAINLLAADVPPKFVEAALGRRKEIPLGGDFRPDPKSPVFVAVGHGGRIVLSRDDGKTWKQVFWGHAGSDHGLWATKAVAYSSGVFVVPIGWGAPGAWLASDDGANWRHLTSGETKLKGIKGADGDPAVMPGTWGIAGGKGVFVTGGYMTMAATPDFGKTITTFSLREFKNDPRSRKLVTHHVGPVYCGDASGRFLSLVGKEFWLVGSKAARASADGRLWRDLPRGIPIGKIAASPEGTLISINRQRFNILRSADRGDSWVEVYAFQPETEHVHGAQGLRDVAFGYVTAQPLDR